MSSITVRQGKNTASIDFQPGETLLSALRNAGYSIPAACGGKGRCGKCRVNVNGVPRLACKAVPQDNYEVILSENAGGVILGSLAALPKAQKGRSGLAAAADLGTTTVVLRLFELSAGRLISEKRDWNCQSAYGADVISRIQYTIENKNGLSELSNRIRSQISTLLKEALDEANQSIGDVREIVIAGNTVMQHIFDNRPVESIARAPFKPQTLFENSAGTPLEGIPVRFAGCVAGYVGGDITSGILADGIADMAGERLFLDIGTNGEMALGSKNGFLCCAVASGPAFEGAGISCGMPGIAGAVSHVRYDKGFLFDVIGTSEPKGICGSGLVDLAAILLDSGVIDPGGRLLPPENVPENMRRYVTRDENGNGVFHLTNNVYLNALDVRNLQLAKAAVAGGIRVLLEQRGISASDLQSVELAGGFGSYIAPQSAVRIGMLPKECLGKIRAMGNTSLAGASMLALDEAYWDKLGKISDMCHYIELSGRPDFSTAFTDNLVF
jgi:uncharacterized 2Fe-2S/4Fe-4S cluster protein (DUF4445 family)